VIASYQKVVAANPKDAQSLAHLGHFLYADQRYNEAESIFQKSLEINPELPATQASWGV
jgi:cytochrome c-type biogenesis protein CcmH/NrfG